MCHGSCRRLLTFLLWLFRSGSWDFWSSCILLFIIYPKGAGAQLFLVSLNGFPENRILLLEETLCPGASTAGKRPRSQPIWAFSVPWSIRLLFCHTFNFCGFALDFEIRKWIPPASSSSCNCFGYLGSFVVPHEF